MRLLMDLLGISPGSDKGLIGVAVVAFIAGIGGGVLGVLLTAYRWVLPLALLELVLVPVLIWRASRAKSGDRL